MKTREVLFLALMIIGITFCIFGCINFTNTQLCISLCALGVAILLLDQKVIDYE